MTDIPTALTYREDNLLRSICVGHVCYEAGALLGHSTVVIAQAAKALVSVDPHDGYPTWQPRPTWQPFLRNLRQHGVIDKVTPIRAVFQEHPPAKDTEVAFADLTGDASITREFLQLTSRVPMILMHDYGRQNCHGMSRVVDEFIQLHHPIVTRVDTLIAMDRT